MAQRASRPLPMFPMAAVKSGRFRLDWAITAIQWLCARSWRYSYANDLWEYNPSTNEWTFMGGNTDACTQINPTTCGYYWPGVYGTKGVAATNNLPGGRFDAVSWTDSSGNFWLFGGTGEDSTGSGGGGYLNDLWEFNPATGEWTWESGSSTAGADGIYGTMGTPSKATHPEPAIGGSVGSILAAISGY